MAGKDTPLITPADGGRFMVSVSEDTVGLLNYVAKVNFRRDGDVEARREGWTKFRPNPALPETQHAIGGKLTLLAENVRPNGERCLVAATPTTIYRFTYETGTWAVIGSGFSAAGRRWQWVTIDGFIVLNNAVDLPVSYRVEDSAVVPLKELREVGIANVGWITEYYGFLFGLNVAVIKSTALDAVMTGVNPYGPVDPALCNRIPYRVLWSEPGQPTNWAPLFRVTMNAASAAITLPFPSSIFVPGVTRVAVINGGPNGTTLGGDDAHPEGILVTAVDGNRVTLELSTDAALHYPREVQVTRWTDISAITGYKDLEGDASHLICGKELNGMLVVYRTRGIFVGRYTAQVSDPFEFRERPKCHNVPIWGEAVANIGGEYHLYPGQGNSFYAFDGVNPPTVHPVTDDYRQRFFAELGHDSDVWAIDNPITKEVWFARPSYTFCYDYLTRGGTGSEIDAEIDAAAFVTEPGTTTDCFIVSTGGNVFTYGRIDGRPTTWLRNGVNPGGVLRWGLTAFGDTRNEKILSAYLLQLDSSQTAVPLRVRLFARFSASAEPEELMDETIADPAIDGGFIPTDFLGTYFQDEIRIDTGAAVDADVRFVGRLMERSIVQSGGIARNHA